ncbi:hypothetical protein EJ08DRAFT_667400 [Tothia fuscella]|uniref:KilA/APSES-type HTH DNA-binding domain-containing protein n=1 Tax=Tothia fuscella TaxID=1048955 RepID=A0A9P4P2B6_9PEZI|nr:hypothetical protein EJ08DRAFT_667400 [Tothia fuscella]
MEEACSFVSAITPVILGTPCTAHQPAGIGWLSVKPQRSPSFLGLRQPHPIQLSGLHASVGIPHKNRGGPQNTHTILVLFQRYQTPPSCISLLKHGSYSGILLRQSSPSLPGKVRELAGAGACACAAAVPTDCSSRRIPFLFIWSLTKYRRVFALDSRPTPTSNAKLELPSISQVHSRGQVDASWYNPQFTPRPTVSSERLPAIQQQGTSSASSSPRGGSLAGSSVYNGSASSATSYTPSVNGHPNGFKTPSPEATPQTYSRDNHGLSEHQESPYSHQPSFGFAGDSYNSMNQIAPYADVHQSHMASHHAQSSGPPSGLGHYSYQPPLLQPGPQSYPSAQSSYSQYPYAQSGHPVSSSMSNNIMSQPLPQLPELSAMSSAPGSQALTGSQYQSGHTFDQTGQIAPPGMKPRVTATLWEDEGSLCFQVEAKGVCVARREDNHMINGTKLLNVAGMTRGRRDGILKSEKTRHVVKIGPMHLKGVWIPFDRALDFANKEKITEQLYPLFVHDIGALLYHPSNQPRPGMQNSSALAAVDSRRRSDTRYMAQPPVSQAPPLHHHHSMSTPMSSQPPHALAPHPSSGRPSLDRAHTFPTPPTSASSNFGVGSHAGSYEWQQNSQPLSIDTGLAARSVPTTPASTPPHSTIPGMQYQTSQPYDASRQVYTAPPTQAPYPSQMRAFGGPLKSEMPPPGPRAGELEQGGEAKPIAHSAGGEEEAEHEQDSEYTHAGAPYNPNRASYNYQPNPPAVSRVSEELAASPHQNGSSRATPRTAEPQQWQQTAYGGPPQPQSSSNVYSVMEPRAANGEPYSYPSTYTNGTVPSTKRGRELDDEEADDSAKRQRTGHETPEGGPVGGSPYNSANRPRATAISRRTR